VVLEYQVEAEAEQLLVVEEWLAAVAVLAREVVSVAQVVLEISLLAEQVLLVLSTQESRVAEQVLQVLEVQG
jgi:hypothetical protein